MPPQPILQQKPWTLLSLVLPILKSSVTLQSLVSNASIVVPPHTNFTAGHGILAPQFYKFLYLKHAGTKHYTTPWPHFLLRGGAQVVMVIRCRLPLMVAADDDP